MPLAPADILFSADSSTQLKIDWHQDFIQFPDSVRKYMDECWARYETEAAATGKVLFNGPVTLYRGHQSKGNVLTLQLSPGDYETHLVTTIRERSWFAANAPELILPGLGNSVLLVTQDNQVVFGVRSHKVAAHSGKAHVFGGVLDDLGVPWRPSYHANIDGLIQHLRNELLEELFIQELELVGQPQLLGLFRDRALMQPELTWRWITQVGIDELKRRVADSEHASLLTLPFYSAATAEQKSHATDTLTPLALAAWKQLKSE